MFFNERFMASPHDKIFHEQNIFTYFLVCERLSNDDFGVARGAIFQEIWPGAGFKTGDFVKEKLGGGYHRTTQEWKKVAAIDMPSYAPFL